MSTPDEKKAQLKRAIRQLVRAEVEDSWKGTAYPEDREIISDNLKSVRARVATPVARLELVS